MVAAVFLWAGLALVVASVWLLWGPEAGSFAVGAYGVLAAAVGAAGMLPDRGDRRRL